MGFFSISGGIAVVGLYTFWENNNRRRLEQAQEADVHEMVPLNSPTADGGGTSTDG